MLQSTFQSELFYPEVPDTLSLREVDIPLLQNLSKMLLLKNIFFLKKFGGGASPGPHWDDATGHDIHSKTDVWMSVGRTLSSIDKMTTQKIT